MRDPGAPWALTAALLPAEALADWIGLDAMPAWVFMVSTTLAVALLGQFALSPIMIAVLFGAVLGSLDSLPADPTWAVPAGRPVSTTISPFASGVIMLSRITGHPGWRLTWCWKVVFTGLTVVALGVAYRVIGGPG